MRENQIRSLKRLDLKGFEWAAGELVWFIYYDGARKPMLTMRKTDDRTTAEGLHIDMAGILDRQEQYLFFHRGYLEKEGVDSFDPISHIEIMGERWDFSKRRSMGEYYGPTGGIHDVFRIIVRRAVELDSTVEGEDFGFGCQTNG